ncbi:hypothetical protein [Aneurinibacillus aneurinilyticus]|uniref:Uncharacterized protein n=1 Tax=Aneurinibacillus aneurinilyticus TaxID=1391 RepID=A0A848CYD3_ANEAE|nr:hypothetical protein [Aneurinibacillus aneurinilyticus]NMF00446.1 hypothetical protein [Aneurinibacillus aneurinilyticus]
MGKLGFLFLGIIFMLVFSPESLKEVTGGQKKNEEVWITKEVGKDQSKYSYKVPEGGRPLSKEELWLIGQGAAAVSRNVGKIEIESVFILNKENNAVYPLIISANLVEKEGQFFQTFTILMKDPEAFQKKNPSAIIICKSDKELIEAIQNKPDGTFLVSKNRNTAFFIDSQEIEEEKDRVLVSFRVGPNSIAYLGFLEKEGKFNKQLPLFLKIVDTVTFVK